jgi:hypothetical protein
MKKLVFGFAVACLMLGVAGCERVTVEGPGNKKLTLTKPSDQTIKQGETDSIKVNISREKFRDAVAVRFDSLPAGVEIQDKDKKIGAEDSSATFTIKAAPDAKLVENQEAKVTVEGPDGMKATETFKITVKARG